MSQALWASLERIVSLDLMDEKRQLKMLAIASLVEATTLVLLVFVGVPLKHLASLPLATSILGPVHGLAFLFYLRTVIETVTTGAWKRSEIVRLVLTAFIPFGGYSNIPLLRRKAALLSSA